MITTTKQTKLLLSLMAVTVVASLIGINSVIAQDTIISFDKSDEPEQEIIANIDAKISEMETQQELYKTKFLSDSSLYELGAEWEIMGVGYGGSDEPFSMDSIMINARLVENANNARQCEYGTEATISFDSKTGDVLFKSIPEIDSVCAMVPTYGPPGGDVSIPDFIPQAEGASDRSFLIAGQGSSSGHYGGYGKIKVPTLDETANPDSIYTEMDDDAYIGFLYNQEINNEFMQIGWTVTEGTTSYGPAGKYLIYVDEYTYGDFSGHKISGPSYPTWSNNGDAIVYIQCGSNDDYYIYMYHNSKWFTWDTDMTCTGNTTTSSSLNNSVFLENVGNNVTSSTWSDEVETTVKAWNMKEFETTTTISNWNSASNTYEDCPSGTGSTTNISSSLGNGGTSVWTVSGIDDC